MEVYGYLTVIENLGLKSVPNGDRITHVLATCICGKIKEYRLADIKKGSTVSCGCYLRKIVSERSITHGLNKHALYQTYHRMKSRCYNPKTEMYKNYGGRGISVCIEWLSDFVAFYNWSLKNGWNKKLSLDRVNNDGNYSPDNCRWATTKQQNNNKRNNSIFSLNGVSHSIAEWSEIVNIDVYTLSKRLTKYKWPPEIALTKPKRILNKRKKSYN